MRGKDTHKRGQKQTQFAFCRAGVSWAEPKRMNKRGQKQACLHFAEREYLGSEPKIGINRGQKQACLHFAELSKGRMRRRRRRRAAASPREGPQAASLRKLRPELCAYRGYRSRSRTHGEGGWPATRVRLVQSLRKQLPEYEVCCRKIDLARGRQPAAAPWRRAATRRTARCKLLRSAAGRCNKARDRQNTLRSRTIDLARGRRASRCGGPQF